MELRLPLGLPLRLPLGLTLRLQRLAGLRLRSREELLRLKGLPRPGEVPWRKSSLASAEADNRVEETEVAADSGVPESDVDVEESDVDGLPDGSDTFGRGEGMERAHLENSRIYYEASRIYINSP